MSKRPLSLQLRTALYTGLAISLGLALLVSMVQHSIRNHFAEQDSQELTLLATAIEAASTAVTEHTHLSHRLPLTAAGKQQLARALDQVMSNYHGLSVQLLWTQANQPEDALLYHAGNASWPDNLPMLKNGQVIHSAQLQEWNFEGRPYRGLVLTTRLFGTSVSLKMASDMSFHKRFLDQFRSTLWLIVLSIGSLTLIAVGFAIHQGLAPLRQLSEEIGQIGSDQLHQRLAEDHCPPELRPLIQSFNEMLERLEDGFERLSNYSADIAHELRTPLTNLITQTQVMLSQPRQLQEYEELIYSSLEEEERLARMVSDMLWLAKADNGQQAMTPVQVQLADELNELFEFFEALADDHQITLQLSGTAPDVLADRNMLRRAISNLLSNALRHTPAHRNIEVKLEQLQKNGVRYARLNVINPGKPIPTEHLPHLFERFYRADPSRQRQPGSLESNGLGLAISRSIIHLHQGWISVSSSQRETCFTVTLPACSNQPG
ncbi:heavy metal sensor histidine kinase [Oceanobacter mangrovi]|uniref:heavy metal sensor histidine kinase n=1 Tax=Oceanobacter mangrovi TaxID=2862510 RepID=UPI001C8E8F12|nr:heavy metal sensor histidine kinase [Oceanobacter mangrovi]